MQDRIAVIDIETDGLDPHTNNIILIAIYDPDLDMSLVIDARYAEDGEVREKLGQWYSTHEIVGHNLAFDLSFLHHKYGVGYPVRLWDTMLAEQLLTAGYDDMAVNLKDTLERYFGVVLDKALQTSFTMDSEITHEQVQYVLEDIKHLPQLVGNQQSLLDYYGMQQVWDIEQHALQAFAEMVRYGVLVDLDRLRPLLEQTQIKHDALENDLQQLLTPLIEWKREADEQDMQRELDAWTFAYNTALAEYEYEWVTIATAMQEGMTDPPEDWLENRRKFPKANWFDTKINKKDGQPEGMRRYAKDKVKNEWRTLNPRPPKPKRDMGLINVNSDQQMLLALKEYGLDLPNFQAQTLAKATLDASDEHVAVLRKVMEYKKAEKLLSSFGEKMIGMIGPDGRLHGNFRQIGTQTGRPSCSKPNMLQMPKNAKFRACFRAPDDQVFIVADYSQMELRIMAQLSGDRAMQKAFRDGLDLHSYTASLMFKKPIESIGSDSQYRKIAKTINFGILYGMGPNKLRETLAAEGVIITKAEAISFIQLWKKTYAQAADLIKRWGDDALVNGWTATPFGRRRFFNLDFTEQGQKFAVMRAGANHPIQGTNADVTKLAMGMITELFPEGKVVLQVYDEIVVECPEYLAEYGLGVVEYCMRFAAEQVLTDVPAAVDPMVSRSWSKEDQLVLD